MSSGATVSSALHCLRLVRIYKDVRKSLHMHDVHMGSGDEMGCKESVCQGEEATKVLPCISLAL